MEAVSAREDDREGKDVDVNVDDDVDGDHTDQSIFA